MGAKARLRRLFSLRREPKGAENAEALRTAFRSRYHHFKLLLNANNQALGIMAEMETALREGRPFGMTYVRSACTRVATAVWQIIRHLEELAPGRYGALEPRFREIKDRIQARLVAVGAPSGGPLVLPLGEIRRDMADWVGGKMAQLAQIARTLDLRMPEGFVLTAEAYRTFMAANDLHVEIQRRIQAADPVEPGDLHLLSAQVQQLILSSKLPPPVLEAMERGYRDLEARAGKGVRVALRSSALGEDAPGRSFAGQYRSELNVSPENLPVAYREIVASLYSVPAMTYRLNRGIPEEGVAMSVGCLAMVKARSGGVLYSRDPLAIREPTLLIQAVWGLPKAVVDGTVPSDLFVVFRKGGLSILRKEIACKVEALASHPSEGIIRIEVPQPKAREPSLTDGEVLELARLGIRLEEYYGSPQDVEWAVDEEGRVILLQCRPLALPEAQGVPEERGAGVEPSASILWQGGGAASPGVGAGPVHVVRKDADLLGFPPGGVLVVRHCLPRYALLLPKAAAVVAETGAVAGHLSSVAREFGVPLLFGVEGATERFAHGQEVPVDAEAGAIYEGRVEGLLKTLPARPNLMEGSPIWTALQDAARHIIPLTLVDPDAPSFRPENCGTFHDITRFCHEKAVQEMFSFGRDHHFPERSSKQLFCQVPMQWWVLNLDDGFKEEVKGRYIRLENIASIPMLALWEGITAFPWQGPPPVDGKGFMAVMFEATRNRALAPGVPSHYGERNYFMISRNFCSLTSRLGFHFSVVETLVSERSPENYISFQFKGGAADLVRRARRISLVAEILEEYDFRVEIKEDMLLARVEQGEVEEMVRRLKVLGYLVIQTRQIDMIMANAARAHHYRAKFRDEIGRLLGKEGP